MKKKLLLLSTIFLLNGCAESLALLGPGAANGKFVQSSLNSAISYGVKKQTGKTPLEHVIVYAETKNPERKKQISLTNTAIKKKTSEIVKKYPKEISVSIQAKIKKTSLIEDIAKKSIIYNRR